ncbi:hypothetical protein NLG97_g1131 [Lecanicillium saksenae]|uniref:Uncharacterized protein n=1 Tax=Lecanicillium saksenae TaxID=468837 RepID=A0ACC1R4U5_9HYPO|nr:hypothetical protein NLG97_g1131 [Lecanicillium saksenae]
MSIAAPERGTSDKSSPPPQPSSFHGRLQLQDFMYQSTDASSPRRSARQAASASESSIASGIKRATSSTPSPRKSRHRSPSSAAGTTSRSSSGVTKKQKKKRPSSGYAPPSTYAHLSLLPDAVCENLLVFFVGLNPGIQTARTGHAYAHPTNTFWKLLYTSGVTPRPCTAQEDRQMPELYSLGLTNIVARPSRNGAELSKQEMDEGVAALEEKAPVGKAFKYGWQDPEENMGIIDGEWEGAKVFVASSTSGLAATLSPAQKQNIWNELGAWVKMRRAEREVAVEREAALNATD